jgi:hypothetical protein
MKLPVGLDTLPRVLLRERRRMLLLESMPRHGVCAEIGVWEQLQRAYPACHPSRELHLLFHRWSLAPKMKPGGFIAWDDFRWVGEDGYPVLRAVVEFVRTSPAAFHYVSKDPFVLIRTLVSV